MEEITHNEDFKGNTQEEPIPEEILIESEQMNKPPNEKEDFSKNEPKSEEKPVDIREQPDEIKMNNMNERRERIENEDNKDVNKNDLENNRMREIIHQTEIKDQPSDDIKEQPIENNNQIREVINPNDQDGIRPEIRDQNELDSKYQYQSRAFPKLHYNYETFQKTNDCLKDSKGPEGSSLTYSWKNSTNYITYNKNYSSFNTNKDPYSTRDLRSSVNSDKDDLLYQKTKRILNENNSKDKIIEKVESNNQPTFQKDENPNGRRSYSTFDRNQPQESYYISLYNNHLDKYKNRFNPSFHLFTKKPESKVLDYHNSRKELENENEIENQPKDEPNYDHKTEEMTYAMNSADITPSTYVSNPRIQAIKDKYRYSYINRNQIEEPKTQSYINGNDRMSYQYESNPFRERTYLYQPYVPVTNSYYNSNINRGYNYYTRHLHERQCCCHCRRGLFI